jgi:predicted permease
MFRRLLSIVRVLAHKGKAERMMDDEMQFHIEMETRKNIASGMSPPEARYSALRSFGGVERTKEEARDVWGANLVENLIQDVRYGARVLLKSPGFTLVALVTLALGIGANTAIFSVIYGVLVRPLPYQDGSQLVVLHQSATLPAVEDLGFSVKDIADFNEQNDVFCGIAEHHSMSFLLCGRKEPERVQTSVVSANFFDLLGVKPLLGRTFVPSDDQKGADAVLVLSYKYWKESHGGDPDIVGKVFTMNDKPHTVIGVLPPIPQYPVECDVYMPTVACPTRSSNRAIETRTFRLMNAFARLNPGVTVAQADAEMSRLGAGLNQQYPDAYPQNRGYRASLASLDNELTRDAKPTLLVLLATATLVLLIACANVANLTLARLMRREREMALRTALGAGKGRLVRQLLTESMMLALAGGALGLLFASSTLRLLVRFAARFTTRASEIHIDSNVLLFTLAASLLTGIAFGLMPAFASEKQFTSALREGGSRTTISINRRRARSALIVAQVAISFMLLIGAGLMTRSLLKLQQVNPGFSTDHVLTMRISTNFSKLRTPQQFQEFQARLLENTRSLPGVLSAATGSTYPLNPFGRTFGPNNQSFGIEGRPLAPGDTPPQADIRIVDPGYFETIRLPLRSGRLLEESDTDKAPAVAVINQSMARHRWGDEDPIGTRVTFDRGEHWIKVVGIVGDVKQYGLDRDATDELYVSSLQNPGGGTLLVRTTTDPTAMARQLRDTVHEVDPETAVDRVQTLEQVRSESLASPRLTTILLGLFAVLALVITAAGIAGVMALSVSQRTHEIGVRMALGATATRAIAMVVRQGMWLVAAGLILGAGGALALTRLMSALLYAVGPNDPATFIGVAAILTLVAVLACFVPARKVTAIDPMTALRTE